MSVKIKLILFVGALLSIVVLTISTIGYTRFKFASISESTGSLEIESHVVAKAIDERMTRLFDGLEITSRYLDITQSGQIDVPELVKKLKSLKNQFGILSAYIGVKGGATYSANVNGLIENFNAVEKKREWYTRIFNNEKRIVTTPYLSSENNLVMAVAVPVVRNGTIVGALSINIDLNDISGFVSELIEDNQIYVSRSDGFIMASKNPDDIGKNLFDIQKTFANYKDSDASSHTYESADGSYFVVSKRINSLGWTVWAWSPWKSINSASNENLLITSITAALLIAVSLLLVYYLVHKLIYRPIGGEPLTIERMVQNIALGDLSLSNVTSDSKGGTEESTGIHAAMNKMVSNLRSIVSSVNSTATELKNGAVEISRGNEELSKRTEHQAASLQNASASMEQITSIVQNNAESTKDANILATQACERAEAGGLVVNKAVSAMTAINDSSLKIADITNVINEIAFQTNLLALNAAVEAARAGEQGRGFAVVAGEVRSLAQRSSKAASEISALITTSVSEIKEGAELVNNSGKTLDEIVSSVQKVSVLIADIAVASNEQATGIREIDKVIRDVDDITQKNTHLVDVAASNSRTAEQLALQLSDLMQQFKLGDGAS